MKKIYLTSVNGDPTDLDEKIDYLITNETDDEKFITEIYHLTSRSIFGFALSILKNFEDAEDVMHDCYIKITQTRYLYRSQNKPLAWMLTITKNLCLHKMRDRNKYMETDDEWEKKLVDNKKTTPLDKLIIKECLKELSEEERQIVLLYLVADFKHREIAEFLGIPLATILSKYNRAMKKLNKIYKKGEEK